MFVLRINVTKLVEKKLLTILCIIDCMFSSQVESLGKNLKNVSLFYSWRLLFIILFSVLYSVSQRRALHFLRATFG